jgi:hypothetical protein
MTNQMDEHKAELIGVFRDGTLVAAGIVVDLEDGIGLVDGAHTLLSARTPEIEQSVALLHDMMMHYAKALPNEVWSPDCWVGPWMPPIVARIRERRVAHKLAEDNDEVYASRED